MNEVVKDKMKREIMVVANKFLFADINRESKFYNQDEIDFENIILKNYEYMVRGQAEVNFDYKQPIWYAVVINKNDEIFVYKRWGADSNAWDSRLHNKIAFWVGGHIEKEDENLENPLEDSMVREIEEELNIKPKDIKSFRAIWYINNETDEVSQVHIWVAYLVKVSNSNFELLDWELDNWEFVNIDVLEKMVYSDDYDTETWSRILFEPIKKILKK